MDKDNIKGLIKIQRKLADMELNLKDIANDILAIYLTIGEIIDRESLKNNEIKEGD